MPISNCLLVCALFFHIAFVIVQAFMLWLEAFVSHSHRTLPNVIEITLQLQFLHYQHQGSFTRQDVFVYPGKKISSNRWIQDQNPAEIKNVLHVLVLHEHCSYRQNKNTTSFREIF